MTEIEAERRRLAQRLEQEVVNSLVLLQAQTETYAAVLGHDAQAKMALSVLSSLVKQTLQQARHLQNNLHPSILETLGLEPALELFAADENRLRGVNIKLQLQRLKKRLASDQEMAVFRAVQLLVEEGRTQANASEISISLTANETIFTLMYSDNGIWQPPHTQIARRIHQSLQPIGGEAHSHLDASRALQLTLHITFETPPLLTPRELEIIALVASGLTNKQIATELYVSARTVNFHLDNVYSKLGVNSRTEAALYAVQHGWIENPLK